MIGIIQVLCGHRGYRSFRGCGVIGVMWRVDKGVIGAL